MKTAVVTGANRGIGLELCRQLSEKDCKVYALCRQPSEDLKNLNVELIDGIDVTNEEHLSLAKSKMSEGRIDFLINNAGIMRDEQLGSMNFDTIREQFEVNTLGPIKTTLSFLELLDEGSKVFMMTSRMGSISDNTSGGRYGYRMSKAALNMASASLAFDLKERGIAVGIFHPGFVRTDMTNQNGMLTTEESASGLLQRLDDLSVETSGSFVHSNGEKLPW